MTLITKKDDLYIIEFDCIECGTIVVNEFHLAKLTCKLRLGEFLMIPLPFANKWLIFKLSKKIQELVIKITNKINN